MTIRGPVLVGTDFSEAATEALRQAAQLARDLNSRLIVCHVVPELIPDGSVFTEFRQVHLAAEESVLAKARVAVQEDIVRALGDDHAGAEVVLETGTPSSGLVLQAIATGAGVVVTGPGLVALEVVRHVPCAALIARPSPKGPVVGTTDFSDASRPAVDAAVSEARRRGAPLHLLHAFDTGLFSVGRAPAAAMPYLAGKSPIALEGLDQLRVLATERLEDILRDAGMPGKTAIVEGKVADAIVRYTESVGAELVVLGTHGRTGLKRLTLGSTAAAVAEQSPCSALIVPRAAS